MEKNTHRLVGPLISAISRFDRQQSTMDMHMLRSQEYTDQEIKCNLLKQQQPLTSCRTKDRHCQQGPNPPQHSSHSLSEEPRTGVVSMVQIHLNTAATHGLEGQGQALSAGSKSSSPLKPLTDWRAEDRLWWLNTN